MPSPSAGFPAAPLSGPDAPKLPRHGLGRRNAPATFEGLKTSLASDRAGHSTGAVATIDRGH